MLEFLEIYHLIEDGKYEQASAEIELNNFGSDFQKEILQFTIFLHTGKRESAQELIDKWATIANFLDPSNWLNVGVSFFVYAVISPLNELELKPFNVSQKRVKFLKWALGY